MWTATAFNIQVHIDILIFKLSCLWSWIINPAFPKAWNSRETWASTTRKIQRVSIYCRFYRRTGLQGCVPGKGKLIKFPQGNQKWSKCSPLRSWQSKLSQAELLKVQKKQLEVVQGKEVYWVAGLVLCEMLHPRDFSGFWREQFLLLETMLMFRECLSFSFRTVSYAMG